VKVGSVFGVDFSGAKLAGTAIWIAHARPIGSKLRLVSLQRLADLAGTAERAVALRYLVEMIRRSVDALWGMDFPFGLPIEIYDSDCLWRGQLAHVSECGLDAYNFGLWCCERAREVGKTLHIRRATDGEARTPFDCYHYRIIYQTFHGMRDVLLPLVGGRGTAVLPFEYAKLRSARRAIVEACPSSTLKRMGVPHQNYKQPAGGALSAKRRRTRLTILAAMSREIEISDSQRRIIMRNPGGDALDAVIAAVGTFAAWREADHAVIARHPRYRLEGKLYV